jgi:hypothetical protein
MKPATQAIAAVIIAVSCGTAGYFLGKSRSPAVPPASASLPANRRADGHPSATGQMANPSIDPKALRASLDAETNPLARFKLALENLEAWVGKDPEGALDWLASQQASDRRDDVIRMALNQYSEFAAKGSADWAMKHLSGADLNNTLISIAENWAHENGGEAAGWFLGQPATAERDAAMESIFFNWAANEPAAALEFLKADPGLSELAPTLRRAALAGWAKSDPSGAVRASLVLSQANDDPEQFANTVANWATVDLESSSQWLLANLGPGNERSAAAQELATIFAQQSPDAGVTWLAKLDSGSERDDAASALVASWSRVSPGEAARWATTQNSSTLTAESMDIIAENYFMKNPTGFEAWRATLPPGAMKTQACQVGVAGGNE